MYGDGLQKEITNIVSFLCKRDPLTFKARPDEWDSFEIVDDPREVILIASVVPDAFFLKRPTQGNEGSFDVVQARLPYDFAGQWAADLDSDYHQVFEGSRKIVRFVPYWIPTFELGERSIQRRKAALLKEISRDISESGIPISDYLFVPYYEYRTGYELGEEIYHYLVGRLLKEWGYLVCNEYVISEYDSEKAPRPDICAFKTEEIEYLLSELRKRGIIWAGAFLEELQLYRFFGEQRYKPRPLDEFESPTKAATIVVEVERTKNQRRGHAQLQSYLSGTQGLFDEGYVAGPSLERLSGTITFSNDGNPIISPPAPRNELEPLPEHLLTSRGKELENVRNLLMVQLFKNLPIREIISKCEENNEVRSYDDLLAGITSIDPSSLFGAIA